MGAALLALAKSTYYVGWGILVGVHSSYIGMKISLVGGFPLDSLAESGFP